MVEDPIRRPSKGWSYETLMVATKELFSIDRAYDGAEGGGLPPRNRQRAAWVNDRKLAQTPLGLRAPPKGAVKPTVQNNGVCHTCGGIGHKQAQCPNHVVKNDKAFLSKSEN